MRMFFKGLNIVVSSWNNIVEELIIIRENETVFGQTVKATNDVITIVLEVPSKYLGNVSRNFDNSQTVLRIISSTISADVRGCP